MRSRYVQISQLDKRFSLLETVWLFVTIVALMNLELGLWAKLAASFFIVTAVASWIFATLLISRSTEKDLVETQIPNRAFKIYCIAASVYVVLNVVAIVQSW